MNQPTLNQALRMMENINEIEGDIYESYFSEKGNGEIEFMIDSKLIQIKSW